MSQKNCSRSSFDFLFFQAIQQLEFNRWLKKSNFRKLKGVAICEIMVFLLQLIFHGKNLYQYLHSKRQSEAFSKNTYYRFLNDIHYNWKKLLSLIGACFIQNLIKLTSVDRVNVLIVDDTPIHKNRSKTMELLARAYDHSKHCYYRGFTGLFIGWSDGYSFVPLLYNLLSSAKTKTRINPMNDTIDKRTNGYKFRLQALMTKPASVVAMVKNILQLGVMADYILMDSWFVNNPMIKAMTDEGLNLIGLVKNLRQKYRYKGKLYTLPQLHKLIWYQKKQKSILGSLHVTSVGCNVPVKIVFIQNRNKKSEFLCLLSTDTCLDDQEIVRLYGRRWDIEVFFKNAKSLLKLGTEFQSKNYGTLVAHTCLVCLRYILLEHIKRNTHDPKTFGLLFLKTCDDIPDNSYQEAILSLVSIFIEVISSVDRMHKDPRQSLTMVEKIKKQACDWLNALPRYIQQLIPNFCWES